MSDSLRQLLSDIQRQRQQASDLANAIEKSMFEDASTSGDSPPTSLLEDMTEEFVGRYQAPPQDQRVRRVLKPKKPHAPAPSSEAARHRRNHTDHDCKPAVSKSAVPPASLGQEAGADTGADTEAAPTMEPADHAFPETTKKHELRHPPRSKHAILASSSGAKINHMARLQLWSRVQRISPEIAASTESGNHAGNSLQGWKWAANEWLRWAMYVRGPHSMVENLAWAHRNALPELGEFSDTMLENGKIVRKYRQARLQAYADGNVKREAGGAVTLFFANGDWQWERDNEVCYYYAAEQVWQRRGEAEEEIRYADGSIEWSERQAPS
ncbi:hypothetical protein EC988_002696 [Linderina pennispora]|nr:hypothetical protein EC988_002696 [Linderina pennispora]